MQFPDGQLPICLVIIVHAEHLSAGKVIGNISGDFSVHSQLIVDVGAVKPLMDSDGGIIRQKQNRRCSIKSTAGSHESILDAVRSGGKQPPDDASESRQSLQMVPNALVDPADGGVGAPIFGDDVRMQIDVFDLNSVHVSGNFSVDSLRHSLLHAVTPVAVKRRDAFAAESGMIIHASGVVVADAGRISAGAVRLL